MSSLRDSKAKDAYNMDTTFLKTYKDALAGPIVHFINLSIRQCIFPHIWITAVVTPIFKAGDQTIVANYRPISSGVQSGREMGRPTADCSFEHRSHSFASPAVWFSIQPFNRNC